MKKIFKGITALVIVVFVSFLAINVFADTTPKIKKYLRLENATAVLYSDNKLYLWGITADLSTNNIIIENVKDVVTTNVNNNYYEDLLIVDLENNLKIIRLDNFYNDKNNETIYFYDFENIMDTLVTDIKLIDKNHILTVDNKLYKYNYNYYQYPSDDSVDIEFKQTLIAENVKDWSWYSYSISNYNSDTGTYLILDMEDNLYAYGMNIYGKKINDGNNITKQPVLIAEGVKDFSNILSKSYYSSIGSQDDRLLGNFYLTNDNKLYIMSSDLSYPKLVKSNVTKFLYNKYYVMDGKTYYLSYSTIENQFNIQQDYLILEEELEIGSTSSHDGWYLTKNGNLYNHYYDKIMSNVKQISEPKNYSTYVLTEDGDLISLYDMYYVVSPIQYKKLSNVKEIINSSTVVMEDDTIYVTGYYIYDVANFNGTESSEYRNYAIIKGLPNVPETIFVKQVILDNVDKTDFVVGDSYDFYSYVYPSNAENTEVIWESSNEEVVTVNQKGTLSFHKSGTATIRVKSASSNHSDEIEITVHPKNSSIEILGEQEITVNKNKDTLLKVKINPEGVLPQKLSWSSDAGKNEYGYNVINFDVPYDEYCDSEICNINFDEVVFNANKAGKYTITVTTEDGLYSDSITVNVVQGVTSFGLNPDTNNMLGSTLYIYMKESKYLDLNVKVYPEDATDKEIIYTSSDESIATVDQTGRVTAKRAGKVTINFKAKNYDVERDINILIFDNTVSTIIGDVDGDGIVDILDLVKLRRHVAGVEAIQ